MPLGDPVEGRKESGGPLTQELAHPAKNGKEGSSPDHDDNLGVTLGGKGYTGSVGHIGHGMKDDW